MDFYTTKEIKMENPFTIIENRIARIEQLLEQIVAQNSAAVPQEDIIGSIELAKEITGLKHATIYCKVSKNQIPHFKRGGRVYFSKQALLAWLTENVRGSPADEKPNVALFPHFNKKNRK